MIKRENYLSRIRGFYESDLVKILVGIRRCGKSVILNQIIDELKESGCDDNHIIYINFEYIEYEELKDYKKLNKYIKDQLLDKNKYYIFLDEIQKVENFEEVVNSLRASTNNISIFITGSNSKLLSQELSSVLSGRYVLFNIFPLSYKEFIELSKKKAKDEDVVYNELLQRGYDVYIGKTKDGEVDFIATKDNIKEYYQVAYLLANDDVIEREFGAFKAIDDNYPRYVLSLDKMDFSRNGIIHKNIIDWLLENNNI